MKLTNYPLIATLTIPMLKQLTIQQKKQLSAEIRSFLIRELSEVGGHLASNLGVVELTLALFTVFDSPTDKFFWDIGHQGYIHKIITGRAAQFDVLRKYQGLSGFMKKNESEHDVWEAGHASTAISGATGLTIQRQTLKQMYHVVSIVGDGALTGGMALEALNHVGDLQLPHIIILNDNNMSISQNVGAISRHINDLRMNPNYMKVKKGTKIVLSRHSIGKIVSESLYALKQTLKKMLITNQKNPFFETLGLKYLGPIDGHNIEQLEYALTHAKTLSEPVILHIVTTKGKGYQPAEKDQKGSWHGIGPYSYINGQKLRKDDRSLRQWSSVVSETLERLAEEDPTIVAVTPAMIKGSKLSYFAQKFPDRIYDVGIAEEHAMTLSAGMAIGRAVKPFLAIYSTFLQRAYDQLLHDVAIQKQHVVIGIDRCGFAGGDGETHHGIYDIAIMRTIPQMTIMMGKDATETQHLLYNAFYHYNGPIALRYPRGYTKLEHVQQFELIDFGSWEYLHRTQTTTVIVSFGPELETAAEVRTYFNGNIDIVNARFIKPLDTAMLHQLMQEYQHIITLEAASLSGGFGSSLLEFMSQQRYHASVHLFGIGDVFIEQGAEALLKKEAKIDAQTIIEYIEEHKLCHKKD